VLALAALGLAALFVARLRSGEHGSSEHRADLRAVERTSPSGEAVHSVLETAVRAGAPSGPSADLAASPRAAAETSATPARSASSPTQFVVYGSVRDAEDGSLRIWYPYVALDAAGTRRHTNASDDGHYALAGLAPGTWKLSAGAPGYHDFATEVELSAGAPIVRRDLTLEPAVQLRMLLTADRFATHRPHWKLAVDGADPCLPLLIA